MCSILCTSKDVKDFDDVNYYLQFRGPDGTSIVKDEVNNFTFLHNLLSMTGEITSQPFQKDGIVCLYNGEIYNYKDFGDYKSDGCCLIDLYNQYGSDFVKKLDGEFAILLMDFTKDKAIIATDPFKTKPLFYSNEGGEFGCSTYRTSLDKLSHMNVKKAKANTAMVFKISDASMIDEFTIYDFDLNQHKNNFEQWNDAYKDSIHKRTRDTTQKIFIGLSSGYDSGVICSELTKQKIKFKAYTVNGSTENMRVLSDRHVLINQSESALVENLYKSNEIRELHRNQIKSGTEDFVWTIESSDIDYKERHSLCDDRGSAWMSLVCNAAASDDRKVYLSGIGPDEIYADYGFNGRKFAQHSNFGGLFPKDLSSIFPWASFYNSSMESYIAKEEYVSGMYGLEARYPFLDKKVVQEFLWLNSDLKNKYYKSVLHNYCIENDYPFAIGEKVGF
tara:strand:- start:3694 stop:5034 length:1341 start_codon:yes stop_codon:yes gene_type:complete